MAARLEALAQYYQQNGFPTEAEELRQKAEEFRRRGMPDAFPQEASLSTQNALRFISPNQSLALQENYASRFRSTPIEVSQIGDVVLYGYRSVDFSEPGKTNIGVTLRDGKMIERAFENLAKKPNMFELLIELEEDHGPNALKIPPKHGLFCRMDIDGFEKAFETPLLYLYDYEAGDRTRTNFDWRSTDPEDTNIYSFFASPEDTELISRLSFSFYTKPR